MPRTRHPLGLPRSPPASLPPESRRFFARLRAFDLECPACGEVAKVGYKSPWNFSTRTSRFKCEYCQKVFTMGILAWSSAHSTHVKRPPDHIPTVEQAIALRRLVGGWWMETARHHKDPANLVMKAGCNCVGVPGGSSEKDPCPVHPGFPEWTKDLTGEEVIYGPTRGKKEKPAWQVRREREAREKGEGPYAVPKNPVPENFRKDLDPSTVPDDDPDPDPDPTS